MAEGAVRQASSTEQVANRLSKWRLLSDALAASALLLHALSTFVSFFFALSA